MPSGRTLPGLPGLGISLCRTGSGRYVPPRSSFRISSMTGRDYLSVKLDDPSFPAPIYATLTEVEGQDGLQLIWSRPNRD